MTLESDRRSQSLAAYQSQFKAAVLKHIQRSLGSDEWRRLRALAADRRRHVAGWEDAYSEAPAEQLLEQGVSEDELSASEVLAAWRNGSPGAIDKIAGQPVYYVKGQGIYFWGLEPCAHRTLMFWITYPSYPPKW